jgi:hypothetical protein
LSTLDYQVEPPVNCLDTGSNDATFVRATMMIGGHDVVEEFLACGLYPLSSGFGFGFREVSDDTTAMSEMEMDAERVVESYGRKENEACILVMLPNGGRLNRVFEQMGVAYAPRLERVLKPSLRLQRSGRLAPV